MSTKTAPSGLTIQSQGGPIKILAFHSYTSNAANFSKRLGALRKTLAPIATLHFVQAPITVPPMLLEEDTHRSWWKSTDLTEEEMKNVKITEEDEHFGPPQKYVGLEKSVDLVNRIVEAEGPFHGVLGFSQGTTMAGIMVSAFEDPARLPGFKLPPSQGRLRFCIAVSGFKARDKNLTSLFPERGIQTPVLHVLGRNDYITDKHRTGTLVNAFASTSRVVYHDGGHLTPTTGPWRKFFLDFVSQFKDEHDGDWRGIAGPEVDSHLEHKEESQKAETENDLREDAEAERREAWRGAQKDGASTGKSSL
ncbi:Phospholipase/carboxyhydrolase [Ceraceosorus bombacis]|uniref:Phospholipase/carboxyhydrolase n=1 Tax=Ceraceosorus bombacis TaxID=401625 RepID=A0A0P1BAN6_9BASI|nr:Phospholipase/carboxyhydrolase [Ceraceosorus bombacis]